MEAVRNKNVLTLLINSEGWLLLRDVLKEKEQLLLTDYLDPGHEISDTKLREMRMALINIRMAGKLPYAMIEAAEDVIEEFAELQQRDEDKEEVEPTSVP